MITVQDRARRYVEKMDAAVAGSNGHDATFSVACVLVHGFDLSESDAYSILANDYNPRCSPPWNDKELKHKIKSASNANHQGERGYLLKGSNSPSVSSHINPQASAKTAQSVPKKQDIDEKLRKRFLSNDLLATQVDIMERSPVPVQNIKTPEMFLHALFPEGEKILVFTSFYSQGDFGYFTVGDTYRLGARPSIKAEKVAELPRTGMEGVWFLPQPVDGKWRPNGKKDDQGQPELSRRSGPNILAWRYMLLEADDVDPDEWLKTIAQLPLPVAALYTSAGRSIHALVRVDAENHAHFYSLSQKIGPLISKLGGDAAAISGVRLTRLPKCMREGTRDKNGKYHRYDEPRMQELFYLNPNPEVKALVLMPQLRTYPDPNK